MREDSFGRKEDFDTPAGFNRGGEEAFTRIVEKHSGPLINFLHRYTQNRAVSEDLAQEAFLRFYKAAPDLKPGAKLSTIIYKIAYNLAVDHARRNKSRAAKAPTHSLDAAAASGAPDPAAGSADNPDAIYETNRQNREIAAALAGLPDTQQLAIILKVYEDRSYAEIAEIMELSVSSVESLLFRARQSLSKRFKDKD
ncbi:MAG: sigma-70 family RNA polymerase sigma factor [Elusimicrobia bacterium]|nr:sigma-70 family RNA polymerase sigma factor [Elusimicrobiota bacterium]